MARSVPARVYRGFVRLYPRTFRDEYGDDLVDLFEAQCRDESPVRVSLRAAVDLLVTVPTRHLEEPMGRRAPTTTVLLYLALALGGVVAALASGTNLVGGSIALIVAVVATGLAMITWRRTSAVSAAHATAVWWKLVVAGGVLVGSVIVGAGMGVEAWYLGMALLFAGFALVLAGLALGVGRLLRRRAPLAG